jgi:hypothetical protein
VEKEYLFFLTMVIFCALVWFPILIPLEGKPVRELGR